MNTRRKLMVPKSDAPSKHWHIMNEAFHPLFIPAAHEHVEEWYNLGATGNQRDHFRDICAEIYSQDPATPDPTYATEYTETVQNEEAKLLLKYYGRMLTDLGKRKTRSWLLHCTNNRRRDNFRDVFTGCQTIFVERSIMQRDYVAPEGEAYPTDRTHFNRSVDWTSLKARKRMQSLEAERVAARTGVNPDGSSRSSSNAGGATGGPAVVDLNKRPSAIVAERCRTKTRVTKPKGQFDGVNHLASLGYGDMPAEEAVEALRTKHATFAQEKSYYVDADGCTVFVAADDGKGGRTGAHSSSANNVIVSVTSEPMDRWTLKTCRYQGK